MRTKQLIIELTTNHPTAKENLLGIGRENQSIFQALIPVSRGMSKKEHWGLVNDHVFTTSNEAQSYYSKTLVSTSTAWGGYDCVCPKAFLRKVLKTYNSQGFFMNVKAEYVMLNDDKVRVGIWQDGSSIVGSFDLSEEDGDHWTQHWTDNLELIDFEEVLMRLDRGNDWENDLDD
jgi:hypothetical protein